MPGNPYDGHAQAEALEQAEILSDARRRIAVVDRGYRGAEVEGLKVYHPGFRRGITRGLRAMVRGRSAIEPAIGHMKAKPRGRPDKLFDGGSTSGSSPMGGEGRLGFGIYVAVSVVLACVQREEARVQVADGRDPGVARQEGRWAVARTGNRNRPARSVPGQGAGAFKPFGGACEGRAVRSSQNR